MSLQFENTITIYAEQCCTLWRNWRTLNQPARLSTIKQAISRCIAFLPKLSIKDYNENDLGDFGYHMPSDWSVNLNKHHSYVSNIDFDSFIEWATTPYHESRHAEQTYRIAQGMLCGELDLPGKGRARQTQAMTANRRPREIIRAHNTGKPLDVDATTRKQTIKNWLGIPMSVITHADSHRSYFQTYCKSAVRPWYEKRKDPVKNAVIDWMKMSYDKEMRVIDSKAQAKAGKSKGFGRMYGSLPEEKDAFGVEGYLQDKVCRKLGMVRPRDNHILAPGLLKEWKAKTSRSLHTRSSDLKKVDKTLEAFEATQTAKTLQDLKIAFVHWYQHNPNEVAKRNKDQCIDQLRYYLSTH
jgi:hypothetical protein